MGGGGLTGIGGGIGVAAGGIAVGAGDGGGAVPAGRGGTVGAGIGGVMRMRPPGVGGVPGGDVAAPPVTIIVPRICEWMRQTYVMVPALGNVNVNVPPGWIVPESHSPELLLVV
jgi:hypothetical protein